jgi:hypothetical protein
MFVKDGFDSFEVDFWSYLSRRRTDREAWSEASWCLCSNMVFTCRGTSIWHKYLDAFQLSRSNPKHCTPKAPMHSLSRLVLLLACYF